MSVAGGLENAFTAGKRDRIYVQVLEWIPKLLRPEVPYDLKYTIPKLASPAKKTPGDTPKTPAKPDIPAKGVFIAIGHAPANELVKDQLELHAGGYVKVQPGSSLTSIPGVFAAGDITDPTYRQAVTSAGMGCMAALDAERFLAEAE